MATPKTAAIFWRSAGLGVQRPSTIASTRPSSSDVRSASSGTVVALFAAEIGNAACHDRHTPGEWPCQQPRRPPGPAKTPTGGPPVRAYLTKSQRFTSAARLAGKFLPICRPKTIV